MTYGPGLVGALLTGVSWAKGLAYAADKPLIRRQPHRRAHVSANYVAHPSLEPPFVCLVASGGHSHIVSVRRLRHLRSCSGGTTDDAAGEAFDKVARVLGHPLSRRAAAGQAGRARATTTPITSPRPHTEGKYDFSFSGLKTAVINQAHHLRQQGARRSARKDWAASFRRSVVDLLVEKTLAAALDTGARRVARGRRRGGQLASARGACAARRDGRACRCSSRPKRLCTDNAVMIGSAGFYRLMAGELAALDLNALPSLQHVRLRLCISGSRVVPPCVSTRRLMFS